MFDRVYDVGRLNPSRWALVILALLAALVLAACGDDDDSSDADIAVGQAAPDFTLPEADGGTVSLADYSGQPVLLFFHMADG